MKNRFTWFLYLVVIALAAEVVFLVIQNRRLQAQIVLMRNYHPPETLKVGDKVVSVNLRSLDGTLETLSYGAGMPTRLLYVFNTRCPTCQYTLPIWKNLAAEMPASVQVLAVTSDSLEATIKYQQRHALNYPVFVAADMLFKRNYKIPYVPQTMLLDSSGTVQGIWSGVLQDSQIVQIREIVQQR
jgi:peroxiredoxin